MRGSSERHGVAGARCFLSQLNVQLLFNASWVALPRLTLEGLIQDLSSTFDDVVQGGIQKNPILIKAG